MGQVNAPQLQTPMGFDPTTGLWLPYKVRPLITDPVSGEEYAILSTFVENKNANGQNTMINSSPVVIASDQTRLPIDLVGFAANHELQSAGAAGTSTFNSDLALAVVTGKWVSNFLTGLGQAADTFVSATATAAGNTAAWTPTAGKSFRLIKYRVEVTANAAAAVAAVLTITLQDGVTSMGLVHSVFIPAAAATTMGSGYNSGWIDIGEYGLLSAAANNVLNVNLSFALTAGVVRISIAGNQQ